MNRIERLVEKYPELAESIPSIVQAADTLEGAFRSGGKLLVCGNGGSASDSEHIVGELMKGFHRKRPIAPELRAQLIAEYAGEGVFLADHLQGALPAISLVSHTSLISAVVNDTAGSMIFAQQVMGYGRAGDALLAISSSGNAENVLHALRVARALGLKTLGLTGRSGGKMAALCDIAIRVAQDATPDVQERHLAVYHALCADLEERFFEE